MEFENSIRTAARWWTIKLEKEISNPIMSSSFETELRSQLSEVFKMNNPKFCALRTISLLKVVDSKLINAADKIGLRSVIESLFKKHKPLVMYIEVDKIIIRKLKKAYAIETEVIECK